MKKLIIIVAILLIGLSACKKSETVKPVDPVTTGILEVHFTAQQLLNGPITNAFLTKVELRNSTVYYAYDSTMWVRTNPSRWNFTATIKDIQPGTYKCTCTHWQTNENGMWRNYYSIIRDSVVIKVNETSEVKSDY
jgi:hypothetical protein